MKKAVITVVVAVVIVIAVVFVVMQARKDSGKVRFVLELDLENARTDEQETMLSMEENISRTIAVIENRINELNLEASVSRIIDSPRIVVEIPTKNLKDPEALLEYFPSVIKPGILHFKLVLKNPAGEPFMGKAEEQKPPVDQLPQGSEIKHDRFDNWYVLDKTPVIRTFDLKANSAQVVQIYDSPKVIIQLNADGQRKLSEFTGQHINEHLAILIDDMIYSAPKIAERIDTASFTMPGDFLLMEADYMASVLNSGALTVPLKIVEKRIVGAGEK